MKAPAFNFTQASSRKIGVGLARRRAFTLLEILVVMTLMVALLGATALALGQRSGSGATLPAASHLIASSLAQARQQALIYQTKTRWMIFAQRPPVGSVDRYLRGMQVLREEPAGSGAWIAAGEVAFLPRGVWIVPTALEPSQLADGVTWPSGADAPLSQLAQVTDLTVRGDSVGVAYYVEFAPSGRLTPAPAMIVVALGHPSADGSPQFENPSVVSGVRVQTSGAVSRIDDAIQF